MKIVRTMQALAASAALGFAVNASAVPVTFDLASGPESSVAITSLSTACVIPGTCGATVALNPLLGSQVATLSAGQSWTFDFFSINFYGWGIGAGTLAASLGFDAPASAPNANGSGDGFFGAGFLFSGGLLEWTTQPGLFSLLDGTTYSVIFEDLFGVTYGNSVNVRARLTLHSEPSVSVPEPSPLALMGIGLLALGFAVRLRGSKGRSRS